MRGDAVLYRTFGSSKHVFFRQLEAQHVILYVPRYRSGFGERREEFKQPPEPFATQPFSLQNQRKSMLLDVVISNHLGILVGVTREVRTRYLAGFKVSSPSAMGMARLVQSGNPQWLSQPSEVPDRSDSNPELCRTTDLLSACLIG